MTPSGQCGALARKDGYANVEAWNGAIGSFGFGI
jgi:hypothetical protein